MVQVSIPPSPGYPNFYKFLLNPPRLRPFEDEIVSGEMRVQITYEQFKVPTSKLRSATISLTRVH